MKKLECLIIKDSWHYFFGQNEDHQYFEDNDENCEYFPNSLRYLQCNGYRHWCLPKTFLANNLVTLILQLSNIGQLWAAGKVMKKLKFIDLSDSKVRTLDLGLTPNLVRLDLGGCSDLVEINVPVGSLKGLVHLDLCDCVRLKSFSFINELESLEVLLLNGLNLKEFSDIIPSHSKSSLQKLHFVGNDIEYLPSSIGNLHKLVDLDLGYCKKLKGLPERICSLQHLRVLNLSYSGIEELPDDIGQLELLKNLYLSHTKVKHLPDSICKLKHLKELNLSYCTKLENYPNSICKLKYLYILDLSRCTKLEKLPENLGDLECLEELHIGSDKIRCIPSSICKLKHLRVLDLSWCNELEKLPENLGDLECLEELRLTGSKIREIPSSICKLRHLKKLELSKCKGLEKLPENLACFEYLDLWDTPISHLPHSISLLKGLEIRGYNKRTDLDALLSQEQHTTCAPKRRRTDIEAATWDDVMNESQPLDLNVQLVDQASLTTHTSIHENTT